ncbi:hypothetical protein ACHAXR_001186 [Thalassiosira sp. AJA248-18]
MHGTRSDQPGRRMQHHWRTLFQWHRILLSGSMS